MKFTFCLLLLFLFLNSNKAQIVTTDYLMATAPTTTAPIRNYKLPKNQYSIAMNYGTAKISNPKVIPALERKSIVRIDLIYTKYKRYNKFEQSVLNRQRIETLKRQLPSIFDNNLIQWNFVEQEVNSYQEAEKSFHGFMVYTTEKSGSKSDSESSNGRLGLSTEEEITLIKDILEEAFGGDYASSFPAGSLGGGAGRDGLATEGTFTKTQDTIIKERVIVNTARRFTGRYLPLNRRLMEKGKRFKRQGLFKRRGAESLDPDPALDEIVYDTTFIDLTLDEEGRAISSVSSTVSSKMFGGGWSTASSSFQGHFQDTVVLRVLEKRKMEWKNHIIVEDVTGSMSPYIAQTFIWRRKNFELLEAPPFVFFNDGDMGPNGYRNIGNIKGIYGVQDKNVKKVEDVCFQTMRKGSGRVAPENNLEAVIKGLEKYPDCTGVVMIADNFAAVKDIKLLSKIKVPIQIILCGVGYSGGRVHGDYLKIALKTKGAIYTMGADVEAISELEGGHTIRIGDQKFRLEGDEILLVR